MSATLAYTNRLRHHYAPLVQAHGSSHRAVDWGSAASQQKRFRVLLDAGGSETACLLDVGCGVGHLVDHLQASGFAGQYRGVDLVPEMVAMARERHPDCDFFEGSVANATVSYAPDYIVASGLFTFGDAVLLRETVAAMFAHTRRVLAFNTLSAWGCVAGQAAGEHHADPAEVLTFCRTLTRRVVLRHDYLPHDFTVYLYREEAGA